MAKRRDPRIEAPGTPTLRDASRAKEPLKELSERGGRPGTGGLEAGEDSLKEQGVANCTPRWFLHQLQVKFEVTM